MTLIDIFSRRRRYFSSSSRASRLSPPLLLREEMKADIDIFSEPPIRRYDISPDTMPSADIFQLRDGHFIITFRCAITIFSAAFSKATDCITIFSPKTPLSFSALTLRFSAFFASYGVAGYQIELPPRLLRRRAPLMPSSYFLRRQLMPVTDSYAIAQPPITDAINITP